MSLEKKNILGIDYGDEHVGFAIKHPGTTLAVPHEIFERAGGSREMLVSHVCKIVEDLSIEIVVVGMPLTLEGTPGPMAQHAALFIHDLRKACNAQIVETDERMTTRAAGHDAHDRAAALILQGYVDSQSK